MLDAGPVLRIRQQWDLRVFRFSISLHRDSFALLLIDVSDRRGTDFLPAQPLSTSSGWRLPYSREAQISPATAGKDQDRLLMIGIRDLRPPKNHWSYLARRRLGAIMLEPSPHRQALLGRQSTNPIRTHVSDSYRPPFWTSSTLAIESAALAHIVAPPRPNPIEPQRRRPSVLATDRKSRFVAPTANVIKSSGLRSTGLTLRRRTSRDNCRTAGNEYGQTDRRYARRASEEAAKSFGTEWNTHGKLWMRSVTRCDMSGLPSTARKDRRYHLRRWAQSRGGVAQRGCVRPSLCRMLLGRWSKGVIAIEHLAN
ncbi:hypothetical protein SAMN05444164_2471 [Bradyrhizobium erythrophlei]|uniref:Uncharacterized protein n=2 Tax=Bradyrhizobium erythrophlei TaxID=1437360 RepID=A0A1H4UJ23_9BRAD|nr:hypothetical protein SAMN05444164_2471 [Bradyrhizobium erythrophlei]